MKTMNLNPIAFRWGEKPDRKLRSLLHEIDMDKFGEAHTVHMAMVMCVATRAVQNYDDFYATATRVEVNWEARLLKVYLTNPALQIDLKKNGNRRLLNDEEMYVIVDAAFYHEYLKKDGSIANEELGNAFGAVQRRRLQGFGIAAS